VEIFFFESFGFWVHDFIKFPYVNARQFFPNFGAKFPPILYWASFVDAASEKQTNKQKQQQQQQTNKKKKNKKKIKKIHIIMQCNFFQCAYTLNVNRIYRLFGPGLWKIDMDKINSFAWKEHRRVAQVFAWDIGPATRYIWVKYNFFCSFIRFAKNWIVLYGLIEIDIWHGKRIQIAKLIRQFHFFYGPWNRRNQSYQIYFSREFGSFDII